MDNGTFSNESTLKTNAELGRLVVSNSTLLRGDTDNDGDIDQILSYGGRSFSILDSTGNMVYDSEDITERVMATQFPSLYDDGRSDAKGTEPEGITTAMIGSKTYAFVALERARSVIVFDVTDPGNVTYTGVAQRGTLDANPEGVLVIPAEDSPCGMPLLVVSNESSNTVAIYQITAEADYTLQLLHLADGEAGLLATSTAPNLAALVDAFDGNFTNTLILAGGDNWLPGPFLSAGTDVSVRDELNNATGSTITSSTLPIAGVDIGIHNIIGVEASAIGNHEFDQTSNIFNASLRAGSTTGWVGANFPSVSTNLVVANATVRRSPHDVSSGPAAIDNDVFSIYTDTLDFNSNATLNMTYTTTTIPEASTLKGRVVPATVITKGGEKIGILGATTQILETISSPSGTEIAGFPGGLEPMAKWITCRCWPPNSNR
ncbi:MAG: hypothetical protein HC901_03295 [Bdellovibrionaceae bacterium]|nr:hypothetical protein [Pseudobdellovibrionaceae bacterium]